MHLQLIVTILSTLPLFPAINGDCYVKSDNCLPSTTASCYEWSNVTEHFNDSIKVCSVLLFSSGTYFLNRTLLASNHNSISIIGTSPHATSIICLDLPSLFVAANISRVKIMNISWINCGRIFEHMTIPRSHTTILLHNVMSAEISNVVFNNSQGYALFGVNLHIQLSLKNVTITHHQTSLSYVNGSKGIMLINIPSSTSEVDHHQLQKCFVLINNCKFYNMHSNTDNTGRYAMGPSSSYHEATAIGLIIHQQTVVNISNVTFANIVSNSIPVVLISYSLHKPTHIAIVNSLFANINCIETSVVQVRVTAKSQSSSSLHKFLFQDCTFSHNNATQLIQMISPDTMKQCPLGSILYKGSCVCDPTLQRAVIGLTCNPDGTLIRPPYSWISAIHVMHNVTDIVYITECYMDYCSKSFTTRLDLNDPDTQCLNNRSGIMCGKCAEGLSAVFGTTRCKRCTNTWLLLIPVLAVAGILLVWILLVLNLTVKDGHIYVYILFVNSLSLYSSRIFPSNYLIYFPILMSDLDLGIEVCFYNGMTSYFTIWLQFIFPVYVILLVVGLSFASKYSKVFERLTRRRVIPVIATLYLLAYNKMMFITARGLLAYRTLHYLKLQTTETYWSLHTPIPIFGFEFSFLFAFCILILLVILLPTIILLLFSRLLLRYKLVAKYFKPFLDAYQAPFKDTCYHFLGLEMIMRVILYGCESLRSDYTAIVYAMTILIFLAYLSFLQPFKSSLNSFIYTTYICNLGCITILFIYYPISKPLMYTITFNCLVGIGFAMFLIIILLHIYKYSMHGNNLLTMCSVRFRKCKEYFHTQDDNCEMEAINHRYAQYRDDLLALDPND